MKTFKIVSKIIDKLYVPVEANMKYLNQEDVEKTRQMIENRISEWLEGCDVSVTLEEIPVPRTNFNHNLFEEPNIKILCYLGFSYPRHFKGKEIHYGCWGLYEFGDWSKNSNTYYTQTGEFLKIETIN